MPKRRKPIIYVAICIPTGKRYIGSTLRKDARFIEHKRELNKGAHSNRYLQSSWNKHGGSNFTWEAIEQCLEKNLEIREQYWIDYFDTTNPEHGFNLAYPVKQRVPSAYMSRIRLVPEYSKNISGKALARWANPIFKGKVKAIFAKQWSDPGFRARMSKERSAAANRQWKDAKHRRAMSEIRAKRWKDKEYFAQRKQGTTKLWKEAGYRAKVTGRIKESCNKPDYLKRLRKRVKAQWARAKAKGRTKL